MPQRVDSRDLGRDNVFGQYMDSLSTDEYRELMEEYYRVGPLSRRVAFENRLLDMAPDIEEFYDIYHMRYRRDPDILVAHDVIMQRLFVEEGRSDNEIGRNKGPHRYRIAQGRDHDQRYDIRPGMHRDQSYDSTDTESSGTGSFADEMGDFGFGRGSPNLRGRLTRYGHGYGGPSGSYGCNLPRRRWY